MTNQEAIDLLDNLIGMIEDNHGSDYDNAIRMAINALKNQPEIIRCKDCEHWDTTWQNDFAPNYHYCPLIDGTRRDDFYCADADMRGEKE